ncbi:MAG TPA: NADH-quinone oxidoreductase subunit N [Dehalococcoidia bacterium]|jgi:NADH-quinone oxidoreductase subunit N|nr:NADH-quinone oxidoreductase subunit N [Chloroflexota bacterium]MDP5876293.1 NADH-quinone oxidoreductase subunit N [Dehalococcoidia bacterium]MDP6274280.1 NADH-quinone oxidoreductase subunit N [Dehalococcoidia bacterium]MDP7160574.1 NADH-quinone oxidoreductase subunit N [Dehalococcoidia bacterium]MDP7212607.1 NADH-quinone oxidoreductase subunit N [Dehalococcoidia bacterium]|tara:strand:- start:2709 stop:4193 length:1485 start_codon:yes stop_codon:yes gene_type:complete
MNAHDIWLLSPEISVAGLGVLVIIADLILSKKTPLIWLVVIGLAVPLALTLTLWFDTPDSEIGVFGTVTADRMALFFHFLLIGTTAAVIVAAATYSRKFVGFQGEFLSLMLLSVSGMMLLVASRDVITAYIALELSALPAAALAAFLRTDRSLEAGLKFLLLSALSSAVLLYGLVYLYGATGTTDIALMLESINDMTADGDRAFGSSAIMLGVVMVVAGFGFKMAMAPFQMWVPDVYEGAPTPVVAFLSIASKSAAFAIVLRVLYTALGTEDLAADWSVFIAILAAITMTAGNLLALSQQNIKRMLGYSTVAHAGYLLVGLAAVAGNSDSDDFIAGPQGVLFYLVAYAVTNLAAFFAIIAITNKTGSDMISGFAGMARRAPLLSILLALGLLSLLGIPPTAGFVGKVFVFSAAVDSGLAWLAVIGVINSVISAFYYLRVVRTMFLDEPESEERVTADIPVWAATLVASAGLLVFGIAPSSLLEFARNAVSGVVT